MKIESISGQSEGSQVTFSKVGTVVPRAQTTFLIEHGARNPIATILVTTAPGVGTPGAGQILHRHQGPDIVKGDLGVVYSKPSHRRASYEFSGQRWNLGSAAAGGLASAAEDAMADSLPVVLHVRDASGRFHHWIVGAGMLPAVISSTTAQGTYAIANPYSDPNYGASRLIETPYLNQFTDVRIPQRLDSPPGPEGAPAGSTHATDATQGLVIVLNASAHATITDPAAHTISYDSGSGVYQVGISGAVATRGWSDEVADDPTQDTEPVDVFELPSAVSGTYSVVVTTESTDDLNLCASGYNSSGAISLDGISLFEASGNSVQILVQYDAATGATVVNPGVGVEGELPRDRMALRIFPNPSFGSVRMEYVLPEAGASQLAIIDPQGRKVRMVENGWMPSGTHTVIWDGSNDLGAPANSGLYFARLTVQGHSVIKRLIVIR